MLEFLNERTEFTFSLFLRCRDTNAAFDEASIAAHWLPATAPTMTSAGDPRHAVPIVPIIVPFKAATIGGLHLQLIVEEDRAAKNSSK